MAVVVCEAVIAVADMTIAEAFEIAVRHHQGGRLTEAEALYRQILAADPTHPDALHLLGVIAHRLGRNEAATDLIKRAIAYNPGNPEFHSSLGMALNAMGAYPEAAECYRLAISLHPGISDLHFNYASTLREAGHLEAAVAEYRNALRLRFDDFEAGCALSAVLSTLERHEDALRMAQQALAMKHDRPEGYNNLGNVLSRQNRIQEAMAAYLRALALSPNFAEAHNNLGNMLNEQGRFDEAAAAYRRALELKPNFPEAHNNLGNMLKEQGRLDEAVAAYRSALESRPGFAMAHNNLGSALKDQGRLGEAIAAYRRALQLDPSYRQARSNLLLVLHYKSVCGIAELCAEHRRWDEIHARPLARGIAPHANVRNPDRTLRIGYVSPDFWEHPVAFFLDGLLAHHDRSQAEVYCYACSPHEDHFTARLRRHAAHWRSLAGLSDEQAARLIREDSIDILVDLAGHTGRNRLPVFARKPAPVQVTYLGYCDTTGLSTMDYRLTDALADPPGTTEHLHSEQLVRLPDSAWCYRPSEQSPQVTPPPALRSGHITFGCFNVRPKITDEMLSLWATLLCKVPASRLLLKNMGLREPSVQLHIRALLEKAGIPPGRVELAGSVPSLREHLGCYSRVDIALDTFPYHGTTTTCDALWMGLPVVTLAGLTHASRTGLSLLTNAGLPELVATSADDYLRIASQLASDPARLSVLRSTLRARLAKSPLLDAQRFARNVEQAYRQMWKTWCDKPANLPSP